MKCVDCGHEISAANEVALGAMRVGYRGSVVICAGCKVRYGPSVALDIRLDEAMEAAHPDSPGANGRVTRQG